jgi:cell division protein FtsX
MQLIGEDRSSIRTPFVLVGTFCSIIGTTLSVLLIIVISLLTYRTLLDNGIIDLFNSLVFSGVTLPSIKWWHYTLAALSEILIGGIMGGISSFIAVKSRLKW